MNKKQEKGEGVLANASFRYNGLKYKMSLFFSSIPTCLSQINKGVDI